MRIVSYGSTFGFFRLGLMCYYGKEIPIDYGRALFYIRQLGYFNRNRDKIPYVYDLNRSQANKSEESLVYCAKTDNEIDGERNHYLGLMSKYGQGVQKDEDEAQDRFRWVLQEGYERPKEEIKD